MSSRSNSTKLAGTVEAASSGVVRRHLVAVGQTLPVGALLGVIAGSDVTDAEIDAFTATFVVPEEDVEAKDALRPQSIDVGGSKISYLRQGEGPPLLFVHGFGGDASGWAFIQNEIAGEADAIAFDLPGHGASTKSVEDGSLAGQAAVLASFIGALGLTNVHLVGHSMGGGIAIALALSRPDLVASLTLLAPMGLGTEINADFLDAFIAARKKRDVAAALRVLFADEALVSGSLVDDVLKYKRLDGADEALQRVRDGILENGAQAVVFDRDGLDCPVTLIAGDRDQVIPADHVARCGGTVLTGVGHMPRSRRPPPWWNRCARFYRHRHRCRP